MIRFFIKFVSLVCFLWVGQTLIGCSDFEPKQNDDYFIKVGNRTISVTDFNKAFETAKNAYSQDKIGEPDVTQEARLSLIQQMIEEMILIQKAEELGITITDSQVEKAVEDIQKDYPENAFQDTLIEYAVHYKSWKEGLKARLLIEKVIRKELGDKIKITPEEISTYYKEHLKDDNTSTDIKAIPKEDHTVIIKILRKEKMEKAYALWIKQLKNKYPVEINKIELKKMAGS